jgi:hypothetical protein
MAKIEHERLEQERKNKLVDVRLAKVSAKVSEPKQKVSESFGNDWRRVPQAEREKIAKMTTREISQTYRVSERTALNWQSYASGNVV